MAFENGAQPFRLWRESELPEGKRSWSREDHLGTNYFAGLSLMQTSTSLSSSSTSPPRRNSDDFHLCLPCEPEPALPGAHWPRCEWCFRSTLNYRNCWECGSKGCRRVCIKVIDGKPLCPDCFLMYGNQ